MWCYDYKILKVYVCRYSKFQLLNVVYVCMYVCMYERSLFCNGCAVLVG